MGISITIVSSKGGVGKTTLAANLGGLLADSGYRVLLLDADVQPALSSFYPLDFKANNGLSHLFHRAETEDAISRTAIAGLDLIYSDDPGGALSNFILHTPDGRVRLKFALAGIETEYDFILIDTQGARGPLQEAAVLAGDLLISPIAPDIVSAREFRRGTLDMLKSMAPMARMGLQIGPLLAVIYRMEQTRDARDIATAIRSAGADEFTLLQTIVPATVAYKRAATQQLPVHQVEPRRRGPTPSAKQTMESLATEIIAFAQHYLDHDLSELRSFRKTVEAIESEAPMGKMEGST